MERFNVSRLCVVLLTLTTLAACSDESSSPNVSFDEMGDAFTFVCNDDPSDLLKVRYFSGEPSRMRAERQGEVVELTVAMSGSGARYVNGTTSYWEHQGEVTLEWGDPPTTAICKPQ